MSLPAVTRVACYARVSTEDQAERQTVAAQTDFLRRYCDLHGLPIAGVYVDDGISGTTALEERPEGRRLLADAEAGAFDVVLVYRLDRLGRSLKSLLDAHEQLDKVSVAIRSGTEPFDTASPIGKFLFSLLASLAELERATITERMTMGRDRVARQGKYTGGPIPLGYDLDDERRLVPSMRIVPQLGISEAEMVRGIFARIANGESTMNAERARLSALGVPRRQRYGGKTGRVIERTGGWDSGTLSAILHNPTYKGSATVDSRHGTVDRPVTTLVDPETWTRVQAALIRNRTMSRRNAKRDYLLRGLVKCMCGLTYVGAQCGKRPAYRCNGYAIRADVRPGPRCIGGVVSAENLERKVWHAVREFVNHPHEHIAEAQRQLRERLADVSRAEGERKDLAVQLASKEQERERVLDLFRRGRTTAAECDRDLDKVNAESRKIRELLDALRARAEMAAASEAYLSDVGAALAPMQDRMDEIERTNDRAAMREQIELLVPRIVLHTEVTGTTPTGRPIKHSTARLTLAFRPEAAVVSITNGPGTKNTSDRPRADLSAVDERDA
jgi:site-specific DNA recombinase